MLDNGITLVGNLTEDPELKVTSAGVAVASFRLACSRRVFDRASNSWRDGDASFFPITAWRQLAQNVHSSLRKGDRAVVVGRARQRSYEWAGERRTRFEVEAELVGAELSWSCAQLQRTRRVAAESTDETDVPADPFAEPASEAVPHDGAPPTDETVGLAETSEKQLLSEDPAVEPAGDVDAAVFAGRELAAT